MFISREIVLYASLPAKKYRWITYLTIPITGLAGLNLFLIPTKELMEKHDEIIAKRALEAKKNKEEGSSNLDTSRGTLPQRLQRVDFRKMFSLKTIWNNIQDKPRDCAIMILTGIVFPSMGFLYTRRILHIITLLPGERVRFTFFPLAHRPPSTLELSIRDVSCRQSRQSKHNYSILKLKNRWGYYLVHKNDGQFLEPKLYDNHLGYKRAWDV